MSYITREDGEHFVVPSYRDVLTVKQKSQLKKEVLQLSKSYGEFVAIQKKNVSQYEVAYSPDTGYLLGESIWHQFKKPLDMIYCETIPNTTDAILVIVKSGSVYLDGSFPLENITEELIIFLTQQNNFEIYIYGDVPISKEPEQGKFNFEAASVKSFTVLDKPIFPKLPLLKIYQLRNVDIALKELGVGEFPLKPIIMLLVLAGLGWGIYEMFFKPAPPPPPEVVVNPFQGYFDTLSSVAPDEAIIKFAAVYKLFLQIPGWSASTINFSGSGVLANMISNGGSIADLNAWCAQHKANANIQVNGISVSLSIQIANRSIPDKIYPTQQVLGILIDRIAKVLPGNTLSMGTYDRGNDFSTVDFSINLISASPALIDLIGKQLTGLPLALKSVAGTIDETGGFNGSIILKALGR